MTLTLTIPDDVSAELTAKYGDPSRAALEALAAEAYESGGFSLAQVRSMLSLGSRWEAQDVLSRHGVWPGTTEEDLRSDLGALGKLDAAR